MGRFGRKIQRKQSNSSAVSVSKEMLGRLGYTKVAGDAAEARGLPALAAQIEAFSGPMLDDYQEAPDEALPAIFSYAILGWNVGLLALLRGDHDAAAIARQLMAPMLAAETPEEQAAMLSMLEGLIGLRQSVFATDPRVVDTYAIKRGPGGFQITAAGSTVVPLKK